jgi:hypothetical protein
MSACSPDLNRIENACAQFKALLRKAAERPVDGLRAATGRIADGCRPAACANDFNTCGYHPDR